MGAASIHHTIHTFCILNLSLITNIKHSITIPNLFCVISPGLTAPIIDIVRAEQKTVGSAAAVAVVIVVVVVIAVVVVEVFAVIVITGCNK